MRDELPSPDYRADIDGLRALAIISVVSYHAFPNWLTGGFIGVDIFFVISGYLISLIIISGLRKKTFKFSTFYRRRILRIFPSLIAVLVTTQIVGWLTLFAEEYSEVGMHSVAGVFFASNILMWNEVGYFDSIAEQKMLLHLWSLGVEEQFYILWPILLALVWKKNWSFIGVAIIIAEFSFLYSVLNTSVAPASAYYLLASRAWELIAGGILAYMMINKPALVRIESEWQSIFGFLFVIAGLLLIDSADDFPGFWVLLPIAGALLLISSSQYSWLSKRILSSKMLVWIGLISYPLYLWHWPIISYLTVSKGDELNSAEMILAVVLSIILAWGTYLYIERPIRTGHCQRFKALSLSVVMLFVAMFGYSIYLNDGYPNRTPNLNYASYMQTSVLSNKAKECFGVAYAHEKDRGWYCSLGASATPPLYFAYGDSHALSLLPALEMFSEKNHVNILFAGVSGCPPFFGVQSMNSKKIAKKYNCRELWERVFNYVKENDIKNVILISRWTYYLGGITPPNDFNGITTDLSLSQTKEVSRSSFEYGLLETIKRYKDIGVRIYIVEDNPQQKMNPKNVIRRHLGHLSDTSINDASVAYSEHREHQALATKIFDKYVPDEIVRINFDSMLCDAGYCRLADSGRFLYYDDDHLSVAGARYVYPILEKSILSAAQ